MGNRRKDAWPRILHLAIQHQWPAATDGTQACIGADPRLFDLAASKNVAEAKRICGVCPARADCLMLGLLRKETGVWGGELLNEGRVEATAAPAA